MPMTRKSRPFIYTPSRIGLADRMAGIINQYLLPGERCCRVFSDPALLRDELRQRGGRRAFAVLLAADRNELAQMVRMAPWFERMPLIIMIPDHHRTSIALAHLLRPRYIMWPDIDVTEMDLVLRHMVDRVVAGHRPPTAVHPPVLIVQADGRRCFIVHYAKKEDRSRGATTSAGLRDNGDRRSPLKSACFCRRRTLNRKLRWSRQMNHREPK